MPIYEYVCDDCGYDFERLQPFSAEPERACPRCRGAVRRVISPVGVIFKGSGWYITDSKRQLVGSSPATGRQLGDGGARDKAPAGVEPGAATADAKTSVPAGKDSDGGGSAKGGDAAAAKKTARPKAAGS